MKKKYELLNEAKKDFAFFTCSCSSHSLSVVRWQGEDEIYFSVWQTGGVGGKMTLFQRLKNCWKVLSSGTPYEDQLVFDKKTAKDLVKYLSPLCK